MRRETDFSPDEETAGALLGFEVPDFEVPDFDLFFLRFLRAIRFRLLLVQVGQPANIQACIT